MENEVRINAAAAEMNNVIQSLLQRNINLAGDLAVAISQIEALKSQIEALHKLREDTLADCNPA